MGVTLLQDRYPDVWKLTDIYDPDIDTDGLEASGKHVPAIGSIVLDMNQPADVPIPAYAVIAVDQVTFKPTLRPLTSLLELNVADRLVTYGSNQYMLYYDDRETPTRLRIDSNLLILGDNSAEYILYKRNPATGLDDPISMNIDTSGNPVSERIPIIMTATPGVRRGNDCYTDYNLTDGQTVEMRVFDASGVQIMSLDLVVKRSDVLNDLESGIDIVTGFDVRASQEKTTGEFIVFTGQNKDDLAIFPELEFATGHKLVVPIDNVSSFMYGWDDVKSDLPGYEYDILFKYYLTPNLLGTVSQGHHTRFVTAIKTLVIETRDLFGYSKVSVMPKWNSVTGKYDLKFYAYFTERNGYQDITSQVTIINGTYDGTPASFGTLQQLTLKTDMLRPDGSTVEYTQDFCVTLNVHNGGVYPNFLIQSTPTSVLIYGAQDAAHNTPTIQYDGSIGMYFIPTSEFIDVNRFIEYFYTNAEPPFNPPNESVGPTPTHFTIRNINTGAVILPDVIEVGNYAQAFSLIVSGGSTDEYNDSEVIVEFLKQEGSGYNILFGVPVETKSGTYVP